jgi:hypothetical protein
MGGRRGCWTAATSEVLDAVLAGVRAGQSQVLVLRGEAGVGKSALLKYLRDSASDCLVARSVGIESEMELAYAGLHQPRAPCLPLRQRAAHRRRRMRLDGVDPRR